MLFIVKNLEYLKSNENHTHFEKNISVQKWKKYILFMLYYYKIKIWNEV